MKDMAFNLMTTFPKRVFIEDDYEKPLEVLGNSLYIKTIWLEKFK